MNPLLIPALIGSMSPSADLQPAEAPKPRLIGVVELGRVLQDCLHVTKAGRPAEVPIGFLLTPDAAFRLALEKIRFKCPSSFGNAVFADNDFYYITLGPFESVLATGKWDITPATLKAVAIQVHGLTGKVFPPGRLP